MPTLDDFRSKEFLDQITILNEISGSKDPEALAGLVDLLKNPVGDTSIDYMVVNALNAVLSSNEAKVVEGLTDSHDGFRILCIRVAGEYAFKSAAAPLVDIAESETDPDRLMEVLTSLARIGDPSAMTVFRAQLAHEDPFIKSSCIEALGKLGDTESISSFKDLVIESEAPGRYEVCDITTWKAIEALASFANDDTIAFLVEKLHHKNPTVRRIITDALITIGSPCIPLLFEAFETGDKDNKILSANVLGFVGDRSGADGLVAAFDKGLAEDPNVRYAVYEALGRIGTMKGIICLVDGLHEEDELILMAVIGGLEKHVNPGMIASLTSQVAKADDQAERLAKAVIASRATRIFDALYESEGAGDMLVDALSGSKDPEIVEDFRSILTEIGGDRAQADIARLPQLSAGTRKALAADDSRSMCAMHRAILTDLGFEPSIGGNGEEAYDFVERGEDFDIIITDMNMPVMDGMELVSKVRNTPGYEDIPIIMVTTESEASQQDMAEKAGVTAFVTKPFKPDTLKAKIQELIG
ncbi:HEAT repeat domain-containing protein [Pseudodesulfovibrio sp. zrk46]|uniref:response regulator n=1 Tax=Pseudodesulfovibrio sp. zrk46 TaxID=2725288 RepID=UPI00144A1FBF|nr:HEAT repeat domain-containing protein [Pseudodesulfovibrio sp. zrk46]QJB56521.1 response regulator [Pseudodesulfovibrio sp. zrk46]